jgi:hypothetical protein
MKLADKETWVEDTLKSLDGMSQPQAPDNLFENAMRRAAFGRALILRIPVVQVWSAVACALVLILANLFICLDSALFDDQMIGSKEKFAKEYFQISDTP